MSRNFKACFQTRSTPQGLVASECSFKKRVIEARLANCSSLIKQLVGKNVMHPDKL